MTLTCLAKETQVVQTIHWPPTLSDSQKIVDYKEKHPGTYNIYKVEIDPFGIEESRRLLVEDV